MRCTKYCNKRIVECLILGGAFDCFGYKRSQYMAVYEDIMNRVAGIDKQKASAQISLFGDIIEEQEIEVNYPDIPEFETGEKLSFEKQCLGVYISGHPFEKYMQYFTDTSFNCSMLTDFEEDEEGNKVYNQLESGQAVTFGAMIAGIKKLNTKSGATMAFLTLEDMYGSIDCIVFPNTYERIKSFLKQDKVVYVTGKLDIQPDKGAEIISERVEEFSLSEEGEEVKDKTSKTVDSNKVLWLNATDMSEDDFNELLDMISTYPGDTPVRIIKGKDKYRISDGVKTNRAFFAELSTFLTENCVKLV